MRRQNGKSEIAVIMPSNLTLVPRAAAALGVVVWSMDGEFETDDAIATAAARFADAPGNQRWTFYVMEKASGKFAGYTETVWNPNRPEILRQDMTGVFPEYRNRGLGRWLKAAMIDKVLKDRPQVKYIRTGNADSNAAMLKINNELGFQPYMASTLWQVELDQVMAYLEA